MIAATGTRNSDDGVGHRSPVGIDHLENHLDGLDSQVQNRVFAKAQVRERDRHRWGVAADGHIDAVGSVGLECGAELPVVRTTGIDP